MHNQSATKKRDAFLSKRISFDWLSLALVAIYCALFKLVCIPKVLQQGLKVSCVFFVLLFLVTNLKGRDYRHPSALFCFMVLVSSIAGYLTGYVDSSNCVDALFYAICLYSLALLVSTCFKRGRVDTLINIFFWMTILYCGFSFVFIARIGAADGSLLYYFAGNKFSTSYYFIMLACLAYAKLYRAGADRKILVIATAGLGLLALTVAHNLYCSTAVAMSAIVIVLAFVPKRWQRFLARPGIMLLAIILTGVILAFLSQILQTPLVKHIVVDVLGENLTLTGRDLIYSALQTVIGRSPVFGYGYGNAAVAMYVGYGNAQNSIMETLVNYGIAGLLAIFYMVWACASGKKEAWSWGLFILLYAMIAGSVVEITYNYFFFIALIVIQAASDKGTGMVNNEPSNEAISGGVGSHYRR